jgi:hypothetical protein
MSDSDLPPRNAHDACCGDADYSVAYQDEYQRLWYEARDQVEQLTKERGAYRRLEAKQLAAVNEAEFGRGQAEQQRDDLLQFVRDARPLLGMAVLNSLGARADKLLSEQTKPAE